MSDPHTPATARIRVALSCLALAAAVFLLYAQVAGHGFINYDDDVYITDNPRVLWGLTWEGFGWAWVTTAAGNWHPLTWLSHMLDAQIWGSWAGGHHLTSVLLHAANAVLLFLTLFSMTGSFWSSLLAAALFAVHPLRVESVAWAAERKDVLSAFFWILAMYAYGRYARKPALSRYAVVFVLMALGLLAKPMLVTLPFVLLLLDVWPLGRLPLDRKEGAGSVVVRRVLRLVLEKVPLLALSAVSGAITLAAQSRGGTIRTLESIPFGARLVNATITFVIYLWKTICPSGLAPLYLHPYLLSRDFPAGRLAIAVAALLGLLAVTITSAMLWCRAPHVAVGWLWYLVTLVPVIGIVQVGLQASADRYTYIPLIGIYVAVAWTLRGLVVARPRLRGAICACCGLALSSFAWATWTQVGYWKDGATLFRQALRVTNGNYVLHNNLGAIMAAEGRHAEAVTEYEEALRLRPNFAEAHNNLGIELMEEARLAEAEEHFRKAIRSRADFADPVNNLGTIFERRGDLAAARGKFETALKIRPDYSMALYNLGSVLLDQGQFADAEARLRASLHLDPRRPETHKNLALAQAGQGNVAGAVGEYAEAVRLRPDDASLLSDLGFFLARQGRIDEAEAGYRDALRLQPGSAVTHRRLAELLETQGKTTEAAAHRGEADRLAPAAGHAP